MSELDYKSAGVDIEQAASLVDNIKSISKSTTSTNVLSNIGQFAAMYELPMTDIKNPVLVASTDGVGTKLKLAIELNNHSGIGIDLVAMSVNDLICQGAKPLFFLDYYATGKLELNTSKEIIKSINKGCEIANISLIGGETAEMPGVYSGKDYDLAGFCVGVVDKTKIITGDTIKPGDTLIGIAATGVHSNGFSLVRAILDKYNIDLSKKLEGKLSIGEALLTPTAIYTAPILELIDHDILKGAAHITGGGVIENLPRILPNHLDYKLGLKHFPKPKIFEFLQATGQISAMEMQKTFNCGIGMIVAVSQENELEALSTINQYFHADIIGEVYAK